MKYHYCILFLSYVAHIPYTFLKHHISTFIDNYDLIFVFLAFRLVLGEGGFAFFNCVVVGLMGVLLLSSSNILIKT